MNITVSICIVWGFFCGYLFGVFIRKVELMKYKVDGFRQGYESREKEEIRNSQIN